MNHHDAYACLLHELRRTSGGQSDNALAKRTVHNESERSSEGTDVPEESVSKGPEHRLELVTDRSVSSFAKGLSTGQKVQESVNSNNECVGTHGKTNES